MSLSIRHTGIYVSNLDTQVEFYSRVFGLKPIYRKIEEGLVSNAMFAKSGIRIDVCKLSNADGCILELIKSLDIDDSGIQSRELRNVGQLHIAFTVDDAFKTYDEIINAGGSCFSKPNLSDNKLVYVFFATDPEGNYLEIVEERTTEQ